ncbi:MAG: amino acid ABC transporter permease [Clostridia bacterium]|nr:amino acid ABC transporter permease [Clostridia bacterium]
MDFLTITQLLFQGFGITFLLFLFTLVLAIPLGLALSFLSMSKFKVVKVPVKIFIWIIRGIPLMLFIFVIYYLPSLLADGNAAANIFNTIDLRATISAGKNELLWYGRFLAVLIAFVINYACYFSEIFRGGIESISQGQYEAGYVLGMTKGQIFKHIVLKQVIKRIVPSLSNEIITLVKDTALANAIAIPEIIHCAKQMASSQALIWPLFYTGAFYLAFVGILTLALGSVEKKLSYFKA